MTAGKNDQDPVRAFRAALPNHIGAQLHPTERTVVFIHAAVGRGWTIAALVAEATRSLGGVVNPGGVITSRLEHCADHDPPETPSKSRPTWCGACDEATRHTLDDYGEPSPARCTDCHPYAARKAPDDLVPDR